MLEILYRDEYIVAVNKPSGLLVHRSMIDSKEREFALQKVRNIVGQHVYPVHRLDKPTSGVLLFALSSEVAKLMGEIFSLRKSVKEYLAVVRGYANEHGIIDHALKEKLDKIADKKTEKDRVAQSAITEYFRVATAELPYALGRYDTVRYSLVRLLPKTGRKHQLRRHMKHINHHIIGDTKYGRGEHNKFFREHLNSHRLLLSATKLSFVHPVTKKEITIVAPLDETFKRVAKRFKWDTIEQNLIGAL